MLNNIKKNTQKVRKELVYLELRISYAYLCTRFLN